MRGTSELHGIAALAGLEACVRAMLVSTMPLEIYRSLGDAGLVSKLYFFVGVASMVAGLLVPAAGRFVPRRWLYSGGVGFYLLGAAMAAAGGPVLVPLALMALTLATATILVCFNAYVLDFVARNDLGRSVSAQMFYAATAWTAGPVLGVWLLDRWRPLPFLVAAGFALVLLAVFWRLRLGSGRAIQKSRGPAPNPLAYLGRFAAQPRLVAGWLFAVMKAGGWWAYIVYLPIFCVQSGLGDRLAGTMLSASNALLFAAPLISRLARRAGLRRTVATAFAVAGTGFVTGALLAPWPVAAIVCLAAGAVGLVVLDVTGGLPFLMAVRPSERAEMAAVYASFRDVSGLLTPGIAWLVLLAAPVAGVFAAGGAGMLGVAALATRLHPRLGLERRVPRDAGGNGGLGAPSVTRSGGGR